MIAYQLCSHHLTCRSNTYPIPQATFDDALGNEEQNKAPRDEDVSVDTAPTDNTRATNPYLTRYADRWAKEKEPAKETTQTHFIHVRDIVDFDANPTALFQLIYNGKLDEAKKRLESHPEEAR